MLWSFTVTLLRLHLVTTLRSVRRGTLLRTLRHRRPLFRRSDARLATCGWDWPLRSRLARALGLGLFTSIRSIWRRPLIRASLVRTLVLRTLVIAPGGLRRPLTLTLLLSPRIITLPLLFTLFDHLAIFSQNRPLYSAGAPDLFRNRSLANNLANRSRRKRSAGHPCHCVYLWTFVNDDSTT